MRFHRTGSRRYAVEVDRGVGPVLRMDPAPGYDTYLPHDLQHLIAEEQLGLVNGIFGRLAQGGTASTFHPVLKAGDDPRSFARERRRIEERNDRLGANRSDDFARSERATYVIWQDWLSHCDEPHLRQRGAEMKGPAEAILCGMPTPERTALVEALERTRARIDDLARRWAAVPVGESLTVRWVGVAITPRSTGAHRSKR